MTLDFVTYLREAREVYRDVAGEWEQPIGPKDVLLNDYLNLDVALSELMLATDSLNVNVPNSAIDQPQQIMIPNLYATAFCGFILVSLEQQWTHLMVLEDNELVQFARFPQRRLAHQFVGIKTMLWNSYHQKRQADFAHAWHSFLKLGLNELKLTQEEIDDAVRNVLLLHDSAEN